MKVVVVGRGEKKMVSETQSLNEMRHTRGASGPVRRHPDSRLVLTLHHAKNPYFEDQTAPRGFRGYREREPLLHATHILNN